MHAFRIYLGVASVVFLATAATPVSADGGELYLGLNTDRLFSATAVECQKSELGASFNKDLVSIIYDFAHPNVLGLYSLSCGVYDSVERAGRACRIWRGITPVSPAEEPPPGPAIGEEFYWWPTRRSGGPRPSARILFRRGNMVFSFSREGTSEEALAVARQIDSMIRDDRAIAPLGTFDPPPEIVDAGIPATLAVRAMRAPRTVTDFRGTREVLQSTSGSGERPLAYVNIQPQFRGLGDPSKLRLKLVHEGGSGDSLLLDELSPVGREFPADPIEKIYYVPDGPARVRCVPAREAAAAGVDGRFIMRVSVPSEPETLKLTLIAATEDNLIVTKNIEVRVVRAD